LKVSALRIAAVTCRNFLYYFITYMLALSQYKHKHLFDILKTYFSEIPFQKGEKYDTEPPEIGIQAGKGHRG